MLSMAGDVMGLASSAKSLLGGDSGRSARQQMADQHFFSLKNAEDMPVHMVKGMRAAGLNPMLVATKGFTPGQMPTSGVQDDRAISTARQLAEATTLNQAAQARLYSAQTENVRADTLDKLVRPDLTKSQAALADQTRALQRQLEVTEGWNTKVKITEHYMRRLEYELAEINLPLRQKAELERLGAEIKKLLAEGESARTKADLDKKLSEIERIVGIGAEGIGAVTGALGNTAKAIFGNKPKTIIQKAPNVVIKNTPGR